MDGYSTFTRFRHHHHPIAKLLCGANDVVCVQLQVKHSQDQTHMVQNIRDLFRHDVLQSDWKIVRDNPYSMMMTAQTTTSRGTLTSHTLAVYIYSEDNSHYGPVYDVFANIHQYASLLACEEGLQHIVDSAQGITCIQIDYDSLYDHNVRSRLVKTHVISIS